MQKTVRKVNYMQIKTVNWDQHGYKHLGLTKGFLLHDFLTAWKQTSSDTRNKIK